MSEIIGTTVEEQRTFLERRRAVIDPLVGSILSTLLEKSREEKVPALDLIEALGVCAGTLAILSAGETQGEMIQEEGIEIYKQMVDLLGQHEIGEGARILSQVAGQAQMLAYTANCACHTIEQIQKHMKGESHE